MYAKYGKRILDVTLSLVALIILFPVLLLLTILGAWRMKGNPFFTQPRPGKDEKIFKLVKFRSMTCEKDKNGNLLPDEKRLTKYGKFLRAFSLDELPELWNILKGDMSIVGPRPLLVKYLPLYTDVQKKRHNVRPGLTGNAQVHGRNAVNWEDRFAYDVEYVDHISFLFDCKIIVDTLLIVLKRDGINSDTSVTMEEFKGSLSERSDYDRIVIIGAGGHGRVVADIAKACGYKEIIFLDDADTPLASGKVSNFVDYKEDSLFVVAIGNSRIREKIQNQLLKNGCEVTTLIHPNTVIGSNVSIGIGTVVMAGVVINTGVQIGDGVIINTSSSVDHDNEIDDYCHISVGAHLAGTVHVGQHTWIGVGGVISNNVNICEDCMIGVGAVVVKNIEESGIYIGVPARKKV